MESPDLKMRDANVGKSIGSRIICVSCGANRGMVEAQGAIGREKLPQKCRGRHPHLNAYDANCDARPALIMMGASNLWFGATQSIIVMPRTEEEQVELLADRPRAQLGLEQLKQFGDQLPVIRALCSAKSIEVDGVPDDDLAAAVGEALAPPESEEQRTERQQNWDPIELLIPEWRYLQKPALFPQQSNDSGLMVTEMPCDPKLSPRIRVVAVNKMKKVNTLLGFTRLDAMDRVSDVATRLVKLTRNGRPTFGCRPLRIVARAFFCNSTLRRSRGGRTRSREPSCGRSIRLHILGTSKTPLLRNRRDC